MMCSYRMVFFFVIAGGIAAGCAILTSGLSRAAEPAAHPALFATSDQCMACHSNVHTPGGEDISIGYQWRTTMMANSARDPYWHAGVRRESMDHPNARAAIEDTCSTCHMPMARYQAHSAGGAGQVLSFVDMFRASIAAGAPPQTEIALAMDGVSCTTCHQIREDNFGTEENFDGGFLVDVTKPTEERVIYGRFEIDTGRTRLMHSATGFTPTQSSHLQKSELCASCHTLFTRALDDRGNPAGVLPEQVPYHEWLESDYAETASCQSCHMPRVAGDAQISSVLGQPREDVSRHVFVGGNAFMQRIFKIYRDELGVPALPEELEAAAVRTEEHLATQTAALEISNARLDGGRLSFDVTVRNQAGHKLPTAYPSRRVWLHVTVRSADGTIVFESGAPQSDGSIAGNSNDADRGSFEPHYARISEPDQVQIYESIMGDFNGRVTTGLLYGVRYLKDNRLLPDGFDKARAAEEVAVRGEAANDADFGGGSDTISYDVDAGIGASPWTVTVVLYYQSIGYRWAVNLRDYDAAETRRFLRYFEAQSETSSKLLAREELSLP